MRDLAPSDATALILCGRPGPVSIHTPDVCYRGLGYEPTGSPSRWDSRVEAGGEHRSALAGWRVA